MNSINTVTFIIPSINRITLPRTLQSLIRQTESRWKAVVVYDGSSPPLPIVDDRISYVYLDGRKGRGNTAGKVRNYGFSFVKTNWIGFVDDDDTLNSHYVEWLYYHAEKDKSIDLFCFRMTYYHPRGICVPGITRSSLKNIPNGEVGISFAFKTQCLREFGLKFKSSWIEDWYFIKEVMYRGYEAKLLQESAYNVCF
jgi:glycosyltransferase involved in cell wall biosynthesis